ncbi:uncharacterized protein [Gossypium hirsutum]|uniref:RNase H type-1 domain-containing protein n=1 Tax=Gossypium hirsutum TaxID=3635 RepID=A0A1U8LHX1_GOSHI|nr:uncharacterized protein LOC107927555 [Gossypium hirsutum]
MDMFAAAGGLLQDHNGNWIGILDGLQIALDRGYQKVIIRIDNLEAVNLIHEGVRNGSNSALVRRMLFFKLLSHWNLKHIPKEENRIADRIVKFRRDKEPGLRLVNKDYVLSFFNI